MTKQDLIAKAKEIVASEASCPEAKEAAEAWIASIDTPDERAAAEKLIEEIEEDVTSIEDFIRFAEGPAVKDFGADVAAEALQEGLEARDRGEAWCICDACQAGVKLLEHREVILNV